MNPNVLALDDISDLEAASLGNALETNTVIKILFIDDSKQITIKGFKALLKGLSENKHVTNLTVRGLNKNIFDKCQEAFKEFLENNSVITHFNFGSNNIDTKGGEAIARAFFETKLSDIYLSLNDNIISDIDAFAYVLKESRVFTLLSLGNNPITNDGAKDLAEALTVNDSLKVLSLYNTLITDEGAIALSEALKVNATLRELNLRLCKFEDEESVIRALAIAIVLRSPAIINVDIVKLDDVVQASKHITYVKHKNARNAIVRWLAISLRKSKGELKITTDNYLTAFIKNLPRDMFREISKKMWAGRDENVWFFDPAERDAAAAPPAQKRQRTDACVGCLIGTPLFHEQDDPTRRFCSAYCQLIHHYQLCEH